MRTRIANNHLKSGETLNDNLEKNATKREFDWGPPGNSTFESFKEWLVYLLLFALLLLAAWFFLDIGQRTTVKVDHSPVKTVSGDKLPPAVDKPLPPPVQFKKFMVQLGAFAERKSAEEAIEALKGHGFSPVLSEPDSEFEIYRVAVGPFNTESEAERTVEKLNSLEFHSFVVESD
ncbi:MAG: SPOR domain-containing protein [Candidatus Rifleibacteriota bacterium]